MRLSQAGLGVTRLEKIDTQFPAQDILVQSGQLVQYGAGLYAYHHIPLKLQQTIEQIVREELAKAGAIEVVLPTLQPKNIWEESGRWNKYVEEGTMLTVSTTKGDYCLAPTAEEAIVEFAKKKLKSHKDLPTILFQIGEKYRNELRTRGFLLRGKTFPMMDAYSFNKGQQDLIQSYETVRKAYLNIFERLGLNVIPVVADNGAIGGKKSEEFMLLSEIGEDTILYDSQTKVGLNTEILERKDYSSYLQKEYGIKQIEGLEKRKAIELGHIFQLGTNYSEKMKANYVDEQGNQMPMYMGCYGIGISRTLATIYETSVIKDKKENPIGISLPPKLAPYLLQIIPQMQSEKKTAESEEIYQMLQEKGIPSILDDRQSNTIGSKIRDCKMLGTPYMAILGEKQKLGEIEIEETKTGEKVTILKEELITYLSKNKV